MQVILVGSSGQRERLRAEVKTHMTIVGEFDSLADARAAALGAAAIVVAPREPAETPEPLTAREFRCWSCSPKACRTRRSRAARHQRSDREVPRRVDLGQARRRQPHRRGAPRGPSGIDHAVAPRRSHRHLAPLAAAQTRPASATRRCDLPSTSGADRRLPVTGCSPQATMTSPSRTPASRGGAARARRVDEDARRHASWLARAIAAGSARSVRPTPM